MRRYDPKIIFPVESPGDKSHMICGTIPPLEDEGIGFIEPSRIRDFYNDFLHYLTDSGVNGVKVEDESQ